MENNILIDKERYYKPEVSDLFIGYECEYNLENSDKWNYIKIGAIKSEYDINYLRTPYLTKEQIEAEGWIHKQYVKDSQLVFNFVKGDWYLEYWVGQIPYIEIGREGYDTGYNGNCKSVNEFRKLQNWLGIK